MKIAIVWNYPSRLIHCGFRFHQYLSGFTQLGHEAVVVCTKEASKDFQGPVETAESDNEFEKVEFWRGVNADVALIVTWHRMSNVLRAIRNSDTRVVAFSDTDGRPGSRLYWRFHLERQIVYRKSPSDKLRFALSWLMGQIQERTLNRFAEDSEAIESSEQSDLIAIGHQAGRSNLTAFFKLFQREDLSERVRIVPFTIGPQYFSTPVPKQKLNRVIAISRWDDPQKKPLRMVRALELFLKKTQGVEVIILGQGGEEYFKPLQTRFGSLQYLGTRPMPEVARLLADSRCIVFSSRWEGCPHAALEALAMGATVVGTPIPALRSWHESGQFGTIAGNWSARSLADALKHEMDQWENGNRVPREISNYWRPKLLPKTVCQNLLEGVA